MARAPEFETLRDVIVAPATAPGAAAISIVRLSGAGCVALAESLWAGRGFAASGPGIMVLGTLRSAAGNAIDRCLVVHWRAPASYTGEDMVEWHLHGSPVVVEGAIAAVIAAGARAAQPGEFTRRAFLNGKLDLAQAEAVGLLTASRTEAAQRTALRQLGGGLSRILDGVRNGLVRVLAELEARLDFPDEELPTESRDHLQDELKECGRVLDALLASSHQGVLESNGARVVLVGKPNAGKSSLFNELVGRERALVSPHPGTTRDTIEATINVGGIPVTLVDTAGLRVGAGEIEALGIMRTREEVAAADLVLHLLAPGDEDVEGAEGESFPADRTMRLETKADLCGDRALPGLRVSARTREGVTELLAAMHVRLTGTEGACGGEPLVASPRQVGILRAARAALEAAATGLREGLPGEFVASDLSAGLGQLDLLTGRRDLDESVLDALFFQFCIGK